MQHRREWFARFCICLLFAGTAGTVTAADRVAPEFGALLLFTFSDHSPNFSTLAPIELPPTSDPFSTGSGSGFSLALEGLVHARPWLGLGLRLAYEPFPSIELEARENTTFIVAGNNEEGVILHQLEVDAAFLSITPFARLVLPWMNELYLVSGIRLDIPTSSSFAQSETIISPPGPLFLNGSRTRSTKSGALDQLATVTASLRAALQLGLPVLRLGGVEPRAELGIEQSLSSLAGDANWNVSRLSVGLGFRYLASPPPRIIADTLFRRDTVITLTAGISRDRVTLIGSNPLDSSWERDNISFRRTTIHESWLREVPKPEALLLAGLDVRFVLPDGSETDEVRIEVDEFIRKEHFPLLPCLFFAEGSSELPERYVQLSRSEVRQFRERFDQQSEGESYYQLLNVIGRRMQLHRDATLGIRQETTNSAEAEKLSAARFASIRDYLVDIWRIDKERIELRLAVAGESADALSDERQAAERRRLNFEADDPRILAPLSLADTLREGTPPEVRFYPEVYAEAGVADWRIDVSGSEGVVKTFSGKGDPPGQVSWRFVTSDEALKISGLSQNFEHTMSVRDLDGSQKITTPGAISFSHSIRRQNRAILDTAVRVFTFAWFDHNSAQLKPHHRAMITAIAGSVRNADSVRILGAADLSGTEETNRELSRRRAEAVAQALGLPEAETLGLGASVGPLPDTLPEGRMYGRRVRVLVWHNQDGKN